MGKVSKALFGGTSSKQDRATVDSSQQPYLNDLYSQAQQASQVPIDPSIANTYRNMATGQNQWLNSFQNPGNNPAFANYSQQLGQQFNEQIMPGLQSDAILAGGLGNSRQQIGEGIAARGAGQMLSNFAAQTYNQDMDRSLQASGMSTNSQLAGAQALQGMPWYNLQQYKGILGNPTVLAGGGKSSAETGVVTGIGNFIGNLG